MGSEAWVPAQWPGQGNPLIFRMNANEVSRSRAAGIRAYFYKFAKNLSRDFQLSFDQLAQAILNFLMSGYRSLLPIFGILINVRLFTVT